jgi:hypothetical protein
LSLLQKSGLNLPRDLRCIIFSFAIYGPLNITSSRLGVVVGKVGGEYVFFIVLQSFGLYSSTWYSHFTAFLPFPRSRFRFSPSLFNVVNGREG